MTNFTRTELEGLTKKDLLTLAKDQEISGRHEMTKDALITALTILSDDGFSINKDRLVELKRRRPSVAARNEEGKVIREGVNLSGNVPFRRKFYYLDPSVADESEWTEDYRAAYNAAPNQVKLILKFMRDKNIDADSAMVGGDIAKAAKEAGYLKTKIPSKNLFAYYRRLLEALGVRLAD